MTTTIPAPPGLVVTYTHREDPGREVCVPVVAFDTEVDKGEALVCSAAGRLTLAIDHEPRPGFRFDRVEWRP